MAPLIAWLIVLATLAVAAVFAGQQVRTLRGLPGRTMLPVENRTYLPRPALRRLAEGAGALGGRGVFRRPAGGAAPGAPGPDIAARGSPALPPAAGRGGAGGVRPAGGDCNLLGGVFPDGPAHADRRGRRRHRRPPG